MKWEIIGRIHGVVCIVWGKANLTTCRYDRHLLRTVHISLRVMWRFVDLDGTYATRENLREWWHERNEMARGTQNRIYWRHQRAEDTDHGLWSIQVLYSAIIGSNVHTTRAQKRALRFLSNTPENYQVTEQEYREIRRNLENYYETLLGNEADEFVTNLDGKTYCLRDLLSVWAYFIYIIVWGICIKYICNHFMYEFAKK